MLIYTSLSFKKDGFNNKLYYLVHKNQHFFKLCRLEIEYISLNDDV